MLVLLLCSLSAARRLNDYLMLGFNPGRPQSARGRLLTNAGLLELQLEAGNRFTQNASMPVLLVDPKCSDAIAALRDMHILTSLVP